MKLMNRRGNMRHIREAVLGALLAGLLIGAGAMYTSIRITDAVLGEPGIAVVADEDKLYQMVLYRSGPGGKVLSKRDHEKMVEYNCAFKLSIYLMVNAKQLLELGVAGKCEPAIDVEDMLNNSTSEAWLNAPLDT